MNSDKTQGNTLKTVKTSKELSHFLVNIDGRTD